MPVPLYKMLDKGLSSYRSEKRTPDSLYIEVSEVLIGMLFILIYIDSAAQKIRCMLGCI